MSTNKTYVTFIADNVNCTVKNDCTYVKRIFEEIDFLENAYVSTFSSTPDDPYSDHPDYRFSFLLMGSLKDEKFKGLWEVLQGCDRGSKKGIPFTIHKHKFSLYTLTDKVHKEKS